jgi:hypothetical protein
MKLKGSGRYEINLSLNEIIDVLITRIQFNISFFCDGFSVGVI